MIKKIAVSTFCNWSSYGSMLQAYGLKQILKSLNCDSYVFVDEIIPPPTRNSLCLSCGLKSFVRSIFKNIKINDIIDAYSKNKLFIDNNIDIVEYSNYDELLKKPPIADLYLSGSDQVFNPINSRPSFFLNFVNDRKKRLTYACSMGVLTVPREKRDCFEKLSNNFDVLSVREDDNINVLKKYNHNAKIVRHIDPTFLLEKARWRKIEKPYHGLNDKFILVYALYWDRSLNKELKKLHKKTKMQVVAICSGLNKVYATKKIYDVGVQEFLWLIDHAHSVITSSFHGIAFSIIFKKNFSAVINPHSYSRIKSILDLLQLDSIPIANLDKYIVSYDKAETILEKEKKKSINYLKGIING